jgi:hypothetical protein
LAAEGDRDVDRRRAGCGITVFCQCMTSTAEMLATHGRYNTRRNYQRPRQNWGIDAYRDSEET